MKILLNCIKCNSVELTNGNFGGNIRKGASFMPDRSLLVNSSNLYQSQKRPLADVGDGHVHTTPVHTMTTLVMPSDVP